MKTKHNTSRPSNPSFSILGFLGIYFIVCAFMLPLLSGSFVMSLLGFAVVFVLMGFGYFLQAGVSAATGFKRELESRAYESEYKYFKKNRAFPVWIITAIIAFLVKYLADLYLYERSKLPTYSYDPDSALPLAVAVVFFIIVALGSFVWFMPYNRLMTGRGLYTGMALLFIFFVFHSSIKTPGVVTVGVCLLCYAFCALISANQYALGRTYRGTIVSFMTPQTRRYNMLLSLGLAGVFLLILLLAYTVVNGLRVCFLFIIAALFRATNNDDVGYTEEDEQDIFDSVSAFIFGTKDATKSADYWFFIVFAVFVVLFMGIVLTRKRPEFKRFVAWLKAKLVALFEYIWLPIRDFSGGEEEFFSNYIDEEIKLQKNELKAKRREDSRARMTWHEFSLSLRMKKTEEEKYRYAYSTFVSQLQKMPTFVKKSDTPRKIRDRLAASGKVTTKHEIEMITEAFEQIEYAGNTATPETEKALEALCDKIRENL